MLTLDAVRSAVLDPQPWTRLDGLVRGELAAGRLVADIHAELKGMADAVRDTPGITEDGDDALMDTLDALIGHCARRYAYENPPVLPSEGEVAALPRWARVAFAARCARRVLPLYLSYRPPSDDLVQKLDPEVAVVEAESSASLGASADGSLGYELAASMAFIDGDRRDEAAHNAANAAAYAAADAADEDRPTRTFFAMNYASHATKLVYDIDGVIRREFDQLARVAGYQRWDDESPVSPDVFGPLWPVGPPAGWPADPDTPARTGLAVEPVAGDRIRDDVLEDEAVNLFNALNRYYIARTGHRLTLDDLRPYLPALVPATV